MKAYEVYYKVPGEVKSNIVLTKYKENLEDDLHEKDKEFEPGTVFSQIDHCREIPLSNVMVRDLSVAELLRLIGK